MKKALIASTALVLTAGVAAADVTISGYGRTAVDYVEGRAGNETQIEARVRMNIDASTSTDQGVDFGARIRLQYDDGKSNSTVSPGYVYVTASGLTVSLGNVDTAFDSAALIYESEVGLISRSHGNARGNFYSFNTDGYGANNNRMGVAVKYVVGDLTAMASYVDPDQSGLVADNEELSVAVSYKWNDVTMSAAAVQDGNGIADNDKYFLGAYYTMPGTSNGVGLNYIDNGEEGLVDLGKTLVLYGDYVVAPLTTLSAYIAHNDAPSNTTDNAFGVGAKYDLGGAYLAGSIERGYDKNVRADMGVRFNF